MRNGVVAGWILGLVVLFLLFQLGSDRYALRASDVVEVLPLLALKAIPGAPDGVAGVMNYRGQPVPVIDLSALALQRPAAQRASTRLFVVRHPTAGDERLLGLIAERATEMMRRTEKQFQPSGVSGERMRYLGPVTTDEHGLIQRIEVTELLDEALRDALWARAEAAVAS